MAAWEILEKKYEQATLALKDNHPQKAVPILRELVGEEPNEPLFHWQLGRALSELREYQQAVHEFQQALQLDPENVPALGCLGRAYLEQREWPQAEQAIRKRLALKESPQYLVFLADVMMETERHDLAVEYCRRAIALDPSFAEAYLNLGLAYRHKKQNQEAISAFEKAVELDDRYSVGFRELGLTYYAEGGAQSAKKALETCVSLTPDDAWGHLYLALCLDDLEDPQGADAHFRAAAANEPENRFFQRKYREFSRLRRVKPTG